ncbi:MAG: hypothetical protein AABZ67_15590, partial [Pseudomonadota bacterium]
MTMEGQRFNQKQSCSRSVARDTAKARSFARARAAASARPRSRSSAANKTLAEFSFLLRWPSLKPQEKLEKYSKYACHELNFFLFQKDRDFFMKVVLPYIQNKKDKTFLDHWLIGSDLSGYLQPWAFSRLNV